MKIKSISSFKLDLLANISGVGWSAVAQIVCTPIYIRFLGIEAFGLVGFYLVLQSLSQVLDFGLSPTINREMARYSVQPEKAAEARDLVRTLEAGYWIVGIAIGATIFVWAPFIAKHWIKAGSFPIKSVRQAVMIMGILVFFQWPLSFYQGALMGLGRQVLFNALKASQSTLANGGAVLILWLVSPTIRAFFLWQAGVSAAQAFLLTIFLWKSLPPADRTPRFDLGLVRNIWRFAAGMTGITAFALILTQADKIVVSKLFSLRVFGYYTVAGMLGAGLSLIVAAVFNTIYPRFSSLVVADDEKGLRNLYHRSTQLMAVIILPLAAVLALFSVDIIQLWTRNPDVARNAGPVATVLVVGTALNGLMYLPYALQLANGWTSLNLWISTFSTLALVPTIWYTASHYGALGAASVWVALNCISMAVGVPLMHRRLLKGEMLKWFIEDIGPTLVVVLIVVGLGRMLLTGPLRPIVAVASLTLVLLTALAASAFAAPRIRSRLLEELSKIRLSYA